MKRNGFTLVELLAVIILLGLLMAIAVPSALSMSTKVKESTYVTKIELIEQAGMTYGQSNLTYVKTGVHLNNPTKNGAYCTFNVDTANDEITSVKYQTNLPSYDEDYLPNSSESVQHYWCIQVPVKMLVDTNNLDWDEKGVCEGCANEDAYNNVVVNPVTNYIINECHVYVYYKYTRVYAKFDKATCDKQVENYNEAKGQGKEYRAIKS